MKRHGLFAMPFFNIYTMRYDFQNLKAGRVVIYTSVVCGAAYCSIHKIGLMSESQAKNSFHREHKKEVLTLIQQKNINDEIKSISYTA